MNPRTYHRTAAALSIAAVTLSLACRPSCTAQDFPPQRPVVIPVITGDTLDALPAWDWQEAFRLIVPMARRTAWSALDRHSADSIAIVLTGDETATAWKVHPDQYPHDDDPRVLAWRTLETHGGDVERPPIREALVAVGVRDFLGRRGWMLVLLDANPGWGLKPEYKWELGYPHSERFSSGSIVIDTVRMEIRMVPKNAHRHYDYLYEPTTPSNASIADFIATVDTVRLEQQSSLSGFFVSPAHASVFTTLYFQDGAVRVNTWKYVTGEAPTVFFPNGR